MSPTKQETLEQLLRNVYSLTSDEILEIPEVLGFTIQWKGVDSYLQIDIAKSTSEPRKNKIKEMINDCFEEFILPVGSVRYERAFTV